MRGLEDLMKSGNVRLESKEKGKLIGPTSIFKSKGSHKININSYNLIPNKGIFFMKQFHTVIEFEKKMKSRSSQESKNRRHYFESWQGKVK